MRQYVRVAWHTHKASRVSAKRIQKRRLSYDQWSALEDVSFGDYTKAASLLAKGLDIDSWNERGETVLISIIAQGELNGVPTNPDGVEWLIAHGADVNRRSRNGETPLMRLAESAQLPGQTEHDMSRILHLLLSHGARVNAHDNAGRTALLYAAGDSDDDSDNANLIVATALVARGANVNARNKRGETALVRVLAHWSEQHEPDNDNLLTFGLCVCC